MKKRLLLAIAFLVVFSVEAISQMPQRISYQAVIRNASGVILQNQAVGIRFSILQGSSVGPAVFAETHTTSTNDYGLVNLVIGTGTNLGPQLSTINWGADLYFLVVQIDPNGGTTYSITSTTQLVSVPYALHAKTVEDNDDADANPSNELNTSASLSGTTLQITDGGGTLSVDLSSLENDADSDPVNEIQTISKVGSIITLSNGGGAVIDDVNDADASPTNELNTGFNLTGTTLSITDAGGTQSVNLSTVAGDPNATNELNTSANLVGTTLNITDAGGTLTVNLSSLVNDADASTTNELNTSANLSGTTLNITDAGGTISVNLASLVNDADASTTNELNTGANLTGTTLNIIDAGGTLSVNLSSLVNDADASPTNELQNLSIVGNNLTISSGNTVTLPGGTDSQTLSVVGSNLTISGGNTVALPGGTDSQTLTLVGSDLSISGGNTVTLGGGTDSQFLTLVGSDLTISNGNTVTLPGGTDTDDQTLTLVGADLTIADGNTVTLPVQTHHVGEHFGGGIIIWVDSTGQHGLIAALTDAGTGLVFENSPNSTTSLGNSLNNGELNTNALIAVVGDYPAAEAAAAYSSGGFTDWYLPSVYELEMLFNSGYVLGSNHLPIATLYWSSTEVPGTSGVQAYRVTNNSILGVSQISPSTGAVRCVRKF